MQINLNQVYTFQCSASFETLPQSIVYHLFRDGRVASKFLERQLELWFPDLTFVDGKGYDHIDLQQQKYDAKCFTKGGAKFCPSNMIGVGRSVNEEKLWEHATQMIYIFCDVVDFPQVGVIYKKGTDLLNYPKGNIPFKDRNVLFAGLPYRN